MTGDALHNRLTELMAIETNMSVEEKAQLANNLCLVVHRVHSPQQDINLSHLFLVLSNGDQSGWAMTFMNGAFRVRGMGMSCRHEALHGLRLKVEDEIVTILHSNLGAINGDGDE